MGKHRTYNDSTNAQQSMQRSFRLDRRYVTSEASHNSEGPHLHMYAHVMQGTHLKCLAAYLRSVSAPS